MRILNRLSAIAAGIVTLWLVGSAVFLYLWLPHYTRGVPVVVPDFHGSSLAAARSTALKMGLVVGKVDRRPDNSVPRGSVVDHLPVKGQQVKQKRPINFIVSSGPETAKVPDLVNKSLREVEFELMVRNLVLGRRVYTYSDTFPMTDTVIASSPSADVEVEFDTPVDVLLSRGPQRLEFLMPSLLGVRREDAERQVRSLRLSLADVIYESRPGQETGTVVGQYPPANAAITTGEPVTLTVNQPSARASSNTRTRIVTINYEVGGSPGTDVRLKIIVRDQAGAHEMVNGFVKGGHHVSIPRAVVGNATLLIYEGDMDEPKLQEPL
ncbi:PASTA domain-containing protein [Candidatus Poribacteria bacterium]|nr:PASTA domain-containing protein [Candidatus Poribacteria bacterium]